MISVNKNLFNWDKKAFKSLKSLLGKPAQNYTQAIGKGEGEYGSHYSKINRLRGHNHSVRIDRPLTMEVRKNNGSTFM